ncbi:MAG: bacterial Ig-like domain-containing protein, partial [Clostridia bacterium]|nr:bacterial Ig-like domain-containing protein [Clostridia bacterium]
SLTSVTIPDSVTSIGGSAFYNTGYYNDFSNWEIGVLYIGKHLIKARDYLSGAYAVKAGTKTIADNAFYKCTSLTSVTIPDSVTSIGSDAFNGCAKLTNITIPDSVTSIGDWAFSSCTELTSITIPDSVTSIGGGAFHNTGYYNNSYRWENSVLYIGNHLIKARDTLSGAYAVKAGTKSIADYAFSGCASLTSVTIPGSVTSIGNSAFYNCTGLTDVYCGGSPESWAQIAIGSGNDKFTHASVHFVPESVAVNTLPTKTDYFTGETLDVTGLTLTATYADESTMTLTDGFECSAVDTSAAGVKTVTVTYEGRETSFEITVKEPEIVSISVNTPPEKLKYFKGEEPDFTGLTLTAAYDDGSRDTLSEGFVCAPLDTRTAGVKAVPVTYGGFETTFDVKVSGSDSVIIELSSLPAKLTYLEGREELDVTGGTLRIIFKDDDPQTIPLTADIVTGFDNTKPGAQTLTVSFLGDTEDFEITVTAKSLTSISVTTLPEKLTYLEAKDELDVTGGVVTLYYDNGSQEDTDLTLDMVTGFDNTTADAQTLTVTYGGKTATYEITVITKSLTSIAVTTMPSKLNYLEAKDALDVSGGVITVHYDNGTQADIPMSTNLISGFDNTQVGTQTLTVTYGGKTATFDITITPKKVKSISVTRLPFKTAYLVNEEDLDPEGGALTVKYDNDTQEEIPLKEASFSGFSNTATGAKTITVTYGGKMTFLQIRIVAALSWEYEVTENTFTVSEAPAKGVLYAAFYNGGKLKTVKVITPKEAADIPAGSETVKVMALSGDALPLFEALSANVPNN